MEYQPQEGWFNAFDNTFKKEPNHPDFTGIGLFNGKSAKVAVWKKRTKNGEVYVSCHVEYEEVKEPKPVSTQEALDSEIPF